MPCRISSEFLEKLLRTAGPSGFEFEQCKLVSGYLRQFASDVQTDVLGNTIVRLNRDSGYQVVLSAHYDEVGVQITSVAADGLLAFRTIGRIAPEALCGAEVEIVSGLNHVPGVVRVSDGLTGIPTENDLWIDIGASSLASAQALVSPGDTATFRPNLCRLSDMRVRSKGLDNKIGTFVVAEACRVLTSRCPAIGVTFIASVREEIGTCGARPVVASIAPDVVIVVDVANTTDTPGMCESRHGTLALGAGPGLCLNSDNNRALQSLVRRVARTNNISLQIFAGARDSGGNDLVSLATLTGNSAAISLNIPCLGMHTPDETCDLGDVEAAVRLLVETVSSLRGTEEFPFCCPDDLERQSAYPPR